MKKHTTSKAEITYNTDNIIRIKIFQGNELEEKDIKEIIKRCDEITGKKRHLVLLDGRGDVTATKEAREYGGNHISKTRIAEAILVETTANKLMANVYVSYNKPRIPTKIFTVEEEALKWLKSFEVDGVYLGFTG